MEASTKMRIKLFDDSLKLTSDRLVEQQTEFNIGPKSDHKGPLALEVNLFSAQDVDSFVLYLKKLKGDLPLETKNKPEKSQLKSLSKMLSDKDTVQDLVNTVKAKQQFQEGLINYLRELQFRFLAADVVNEKSLENPDLVKFNMEKHGDYQWMVRLMKEAKDPQNDKYDWRLMFGIKIVGEKVAVVKIYLWGKFSESWKLPWEKAKVNNFKKVEKVFIFPEFMDYAERRRWRLEHRKFLTATKDAAPQEVLDYEFSKFYTKYKGYIKIH